VRLAPQPGASSTGKSPVKRYPAHVQEVCDILAGFAFVDQLPCMLDLNICFYLPIGLFSASFTPLWLVWPRIKERT
jgi:hypothetical protein